VREKNPAVKSVEGRRVRWVRSALEEVLRGAGVKANYKPHMPMYELPVAGQTGIPLCHAVRAMRMRHTGHEARDCSAGQSYLSK